MNLDSLRLAARTLRKQPAFSAAVILSLALGIALNTTMYGMIDALIRPRMEMRDPGRLYRIVFFGDRQGRMDNRDREAALRAGMKSYESITRTVFSIVNQLIEHGEAITEGAVQGVAANYFDVLGVHPLAGRTFIPSDETADIPPVVITESVAAALFHKGESPIGAQIRISRERRIVVGVVSDAARLPNARYGAWQVAQPSSMGGTMTILRLRDGATPQDLERELAVISNRIALAVGDDPREDAFRFTQAADPQFQFKQVHYALIAAVVAVLLVACTNLANIQLARGIGRRRELALRSALGASRRRIIAHLLNETVLLAAAGLVLGLIMTLWGASALKASIPPSVGGYIVEPQVNWRVLSFALVATMLCLIIVGVLPSIGVSRTDPNDLLKSGAGTGATKKNRRKYAVLVSIEIALALALSSLAAVTVRTTVALNAAGQGYDPRPLSTGLMSPLVRDGSTQRYVQLLEALEARIKTVPGVIDATASMGIPVENGAVSVEDAGGVREVFAPMYNVTAASPSYIRTFGYPLLKGRNFIEGERDRGAAIIDQRTARTLWPNADPIGALIKFGDKRSNRPYVRVVGVIGEDPRFPSPDELGSMVGLRKAIGLILYLPEPTDSLVAHGIIGMRFVARAGQRPAQLPSALRAAADNWSDYRPFKITTMEDALGLTVARESARFMAALFALFAAMGVGLAAFGVYGIVAHAVAERRRELGVRVALGATARDILSAVLRESVVVALGGAAGGLLLTRFGTTLLSQLASADEIYNAPVFALVALVVVATSTVSALIPAMRATRVDPTESLRAE